MQVRFILGRAGSGKTHFCLEWIARRLRVDPDGLPIVLLVPEQATYQMERALVSRRGLKGYKRAMVVSFAWLAREGLTAGGAGDKLLGDAIRQMILQSLLDRIADQLQLWKGSASQSGFAVKILAAIDELQDAGLTLTDLQDLHKRQLNRDPHGELTAKLGDLVCIYRGYRDALPGGFQDRSAALDLFNNATEKLPWLAGATLLVDGFSGFTRQQYAALLAIIQCCGDSFISLCLDPECLSGPTAAGGNTFGQILQTYQRLVQLLGHKQIKIGLPVVLGQQYRRRFRQSSVLADIEAGLAGRAVKTRPLQADQQLDKSLKIVKLPSTSDEVQHAADTILKLVAGGYRFRDIAVIVRRLDQFQHLISRTFRQYDIPFFLDVRRPVSRHPLAGLVINALRVWAFNWRSSDVLAYLKTGLTGLEPQQGDRLENMVLANGIQGSSWYQGAWPESRKSIGRDNHNNGNNPAGNRLSDDPITWRELAIEPLREAQLRLMGDDDLSGPGKSFAVGQVTDAILRLIRRLKVPTRLSRWASDLQRSGDDDQAQVHVQVWREFLRFTEQLQAALGGRKFGLEQFLSLLVLAFDKLTVGVVPSGLDQVLVGSVERSRHPAVRAALVLGFNEGAFPAPASEDRILTDAERAGLGLPDLPLRAQPQEHLSVEKFLAYIALTRPSQFLQVSFAAVDAQGAKLSESRYLEHLRESAGVDNLHELPGGPVWLRPLQEDQYLHPADLAAGLAYHVGRGFDSAHSSDLWAGAYNRMLQDDRAGGFLRLTTRAIGWQNRPTLGGRFARQFYNLPLRCSASRLESFSNCPFQHFSRYGLRLERRALYRLEPVDLGQFRHEVMRLLFERIDQTTAGWTGMTAAEIRSLASQVIKELAGSMPVFSSSGRNSFLLEIVSRQLIDAAEVQLYMVQAGGFEPWGFELKFGPDDQSSQLSWSSAKGVQLQLVGRIDRIDLAPQHKLFAIIDYKSKVPPVRLDHIYYGLALQLGCYVLAARKILSESQGGTRWHCAAVLLAGLAGTVGRDEVSDNLQQRKELMAVYRYRGLIDSQHLQQFDSDHQDGWHPLFGYFVSKSGEPGHLDKGPLVPAGAIDALAGCVQQHIKTIADKILDGDVQVKPYRSGTQSPCPVCDYLPVCRFDPTQSHYRKLESLGKNEVLAALNIAWPQKDVKVIEHKKKS